MKKHLVFASQKRRGAGRGRYYNLFDIFPRFQSISKECVAL